MGLKVDGSFGIFGVGVFKHVDGRFLVSHCFM